MERRPHPVRQALESARLLGLIERHGWSVSPAIGNILPHGSWAVESDGCNDENAHVAPTLIEVLTEASSCQRCTGRTT